MYIVLREKQGRAAGHICLEEGQGELCWRGRCQGKAVLLSGEGERWLTEQGRCPFVPVGALVLEGETLLAWGNAPGASLTLTGSSMVSKIRSRYEIAVRSEL